MERSDNGNGTPEPDESSALRNKETFVALLILCVLWFMPVFAYAGGGGLATYVMLIVWPAVAAVGSLILFFPIRRLIRLALDGRKAIAWISLGVIFAAMLTFAALNAVPDYKKEMRREANAYYSENTQEFQSSVEGQTIDVDFFHGPYITYFIYTETNPPKKEPGGIVIDYRNGWYFYGVFRPV